MSTSGLVQKFWSFCTTLRDDGVSYGDYLEQLSFLLFLKMAEEKATSRESAIPPAVTNAWGNLKGRSGTALAQEYEHLLRTFGAEGGMLGAIFLDATNRIQDPDKLHRLITLIDRESWSRGGSDTKGDLYEGLLQKNAEDTKSGAGQYFTPRPIIDAIVECLQPEPLKTVADPASGTGGFFLGVHKWLLGRTPALDPHARSFLQEKTFFGNEIVPGTRRICLMNLFLNDIGDLDGVPAVSLTDALRTPPMTKYDYVLANPPFGSRGTVASINSGQAPGVLEYGRPDFWVSTSNKQLNFLQHIAQMLKANGKAAVVIPDNVLYGGGPAEVVRRALLNEFDVHTLLRLPAGIFYAQGVRANVLFFDGRSDLQDKKTSGTWVYDLRTDSRFSLRNRPLASSDLQDFVASFEPANRGMRRTSDRFRYFDREVLLSRDLANLDISWSKNDEQIDDVPNVSVLQQRLVEHVEVALSTLREVQDSLEQDS